MQKKKIASLFASLKNWWGVEKVQANLSIELTNLWYDFYHILCENILPNNKYKWEIISLNKPFVSWFWIKKITSLFVDTYSIVQICKKKKIDILIWQWDFFFMVSGLSKLFWFKWKTIAVVHTTIGIRNKFINFVLKLFLKLHDSIILISEEEYMTFVDDYKFKKEHLKVIHNFVDFPAVNELKQSQEKISDVSFDKFTFINIGRLTYQKWQERLLKAFDKFHREYPNSQLIILWDWELKPKYEKLRKDLLSWKDIHLMGNKKNIHSYLLNSHCFVLSSYFEGFPLVLLEAISSEIPIISTNCPTWPTEILNWERDISEMLITQQGILVPFKIDTEQCLYEAMKIMYLQKETAMNFIHNNQSKLKEFSKEKVIKKRDELFQSI